MYDINMNRENNLVEVKLGGLMPIEEVEAYIAELKRQFVSNKLHGYGDGYRMIIDATDCLIQPQETVKAMGAHMTTMPKAKALAIVTGSSLARMQIRRLFVQPYARIVATIEEGRAWVVHGIEPQTSVRNLPSLPLVHRQR